MQRSCMQLASNILNVWLGQIVKCYVMITGDSRGMHLEGEDLLLKSVCSCSPLCPCETGGREATKLKRADGHYALRVVFWMTV